MSKRAIIVDVPRWHHTVAVAATIAALLLVTGCGLLGDARTARGTQERYPNDTGSPSQSSVLVRDGAAIASESTAPSTAQRNPVHESAGSTTLPVVPEPAPASSHNGSTWSTSDAIALDRCTRVGAFEDAGTALFHAAFGRATVDRGVVERVVVALAELHQIVGDDGRLILADLDETAVKELRKVLNGSDEVQVPVLREIINASATRIARLMGVLRSSCPNAIGADRVDTVTRVPLGQPLP